MRDFNDLSYDEIAKTLGAGLSAVKMRIHRSRLAFQEIFGQFCGKIYLTFSPQSVQAQVKAKKKKA
jgi:RNA polymerase sigma-70 factor (ECF subfamily)